MIGEFLLDLANILIGGGNKTVNEYSNAKKTGSSVNKSNVAKIGVDTTYFPKIILCKKPKLICTL